MLAVNPDWVPALFVRLHEQMGSGRIGDARRTAERILEKDADEDSPFHRAAKAVLERLDKTSAAD